LPLVAAAIVAFIYAIFDPVRTFFVTNKITGEFGLDSIKLIGSLRNHSITSLITNIYSGYSSASRSSRNSNEAPIWKERQEGEERLKIILNEHPDTFIMISGAKGSGKGVMIREALVNKKYKLVIDTNLLAKARNTKEQVESLARQVGYWPVLGFIGSITNAMEVLIVATTGQKADLTATPRSQLEKVLECVTAALKDLNERRISQLKTQRARQRKGERIATKLPRSEIDDKDEGDVAVMAMPAKEIPVIVLTRYMDRPTPFADIIAEWAAGLVENGLAHVIVSTRNVSALRELQRALPHKTVNLLMVNDASPETARRILESQLAEYAAARTTEADGMQDGSLLGQMVSREALDRVVDVLGGRLQDLELFAQKMLSGQSAHDALEDVVQKAITEIRKHAFDDDSEGAQMDSAWTPEQFWYLLVKLADKEGVSYDMVRMSSLFGGEDKAIQGLESAELISIAYDNDRPVLIRPGRPIYREAFSRIIRDVGFAGAMTIRMNKTFIKNETSKIESSESELATLASLASAFAVEDDGDKAAKKQGGDRGSGWVGWLGLSKGCSEKGGAKSEYFPKLPSELQRRAQFLLKIIEASQSKIDQLHAENDRIAKQIQTL
ncbi:mitochondrial escape protein 2, partial [Spiromyces aspiralis]